jgi:hypothetical protein
MTRREAALILGVRCVWAWAAAASPPLLLVLFTCRESADAARIRERYKKLLIANHPDKGKDCGCSISRYLSCTSQQVALR